MKYWFQIHTGNVEQQSDIDMEKTLRILSEFYDRGQLAGVLAGWGSTFEVYEQLAQKLGEWKVPFYFKTAVFSEIETAPEFLKRDTIQWDPMVDIELKEAAPYHLNDQENFLFRCPSSLTNQRLSLAFADAFMKKIPFDGVFLDRIRYNSLISGIHGIGCFCKRCQALYEAKGIHIDRVREQLFRAAEEKKPVKASFKEGIYEFEDPDLNAFFRVRSEVITDAIARFVQYFRAEGKIVGVDLFTPSAGYFAGQDTLAISRIVDFIKPMLYQWTTAPAGIPFEMPYVQALIGGCESTKDIYERDLAVLTKASCQIYPGIEVNHIDPICRMTPNQLSETLSELQEQGFTEIVASWDMIKMPEENRLVLQRCF